MAMIQRRRPQAQPIPAFMDMLERHYEVHCHQAGEEDNNDNIETKDRSKTSNAKIHDKFSSFSSSNQYDKKVPTVAIGPIGPSLPPSATKRLAEKIPSVQDNNSDNGHSPTISKRDKKNKKRRLVGPTLPPSGVVDAASSSSSSAAIGPSLPPSTFMNNSMVPSDKTSSTMMESKRNGKDDAIPSSNKDHRHPPVENPGVVGPSMIDPTINTAATAFSTTLAATTTTTTDGDVVRESIGPAIGPSFRSNDGK